SRPGHPSVHPHGCTVALATLSITQLALSVGPPSEPAAKRGSESRPADRPGHERQAATVLVDGGGLLRDAGARTRRPGPGAGGVLSSLVVVPVAAHAPGRAGAAPRRARGPGPPRRVAPPPGGRGLAGRVHGRGVQALRRVPRAAARRRCRRGVRRKRRPARLAPHAGGLVEPPPLETGGACDQRVQARGHGGEGGEPRAGGDARGGASAAPERGRPRRRQAGRLQRLPRRALRHPDADLVPADAALVGRAPLLARPQRGRRGLRRLLRRRVRDGAVPGAAARGGGGRQVRGRGRRRRWRRRRGDDARVPARAGGGGGGQGGRGARRRRGGGRGGGGAPRRRAPGRVRRRGGAHRRPVRRGGGGQEEAAGPLQRRQLIDGETD
uniref:Uncharacterized protein n=1 Tax=Zea mays TaxID=4577 RepID=A0A804U8C2_MAIZE